MPTNSRDWFYADSVLRNKILCYYKLSFGNGYNFLIAENRPPVQEESRTEWNYLKRNLELDREKLKKRAVFSQEDKIEVYNTYLSNLPEFNEQRKINWSKH